MSGHDPIQDTSDHCEALGHEQDKLEQQEEAMVWDYIIGDFS